jgi:hypothetical protein
MNLIISVLVWDGLLTYTLLDHGLIVQQACIRDRRCGTAPWGTQANVGAAAKHAFPAIDFGGRVSTTCGVGRVTRPYGL